MSTTLTLKTSHPALLSTGLATPPLTPASPLIHTPVIPTAPVVSYAQLRAHHVTTLKYVIAKLRWEQTNNGYLRGEDAWLKHNRMISKLESELADVEAAQKGLDRFPNCFAPTAFPKPHGPPSKEQFEAEKKAELERQAALDAKLESQFPFIKQLFIGPKTKQQAKNDKMLRENMKEGDFEDLSILLPKENMDMLMEGQAKKAGGGEAKKKLPYEQERQEKEKAKLAALHANDLPRKVVLPRIGPMTREEWMQSLPRFGPQTRGEAMLPAQREQRHVILSWLRKPWPVFDEDAAHLMESLGRMALKKLDAETKAAKEAKAKAEVHAKDSMEHTGDKLKELDGVKGQVREKGKDEKVGGDK